MKESLLQPQNDLFQTPSKDAPPVDTLKTKINDSDLVNDELFGNRGRDQNNDDDDDDSHRMQRTFTFSGASPFMPEKTQEEKIADAVNAAVENISKTYTDKISTLEQIIVQQTDTIESMIEK